MSSGSVSHTVIGCDRNRTADDNGGSKWADTKYKLGMFFVKSTFGSTFQSTNQY